MTPDKEEKTEQETRRFPIKLMGALVLKIGRRVKNDMD